MKTTLDLPERLVREMKIRAATEGRKLREVVSDVIEKGLAAPVHQADSKPQRVKLPFFEGKSPANPEELTPDKTQKIDFPIIKCEGAAIRQFTPDELAEVLLKQEVEWHYEASGR